jgi:NTE family protein
MSTNKGEPQRALVLQGGGALGAYDAGVFKALFDTFDIDDSSNSKPLFNIVAGTSSGAMNAAILVSHVIHNNNSWKGSVEKLEGFWDYVSVNPDIEMIVPGFNEWWKIWHKFDPNAATQEAARRYYSVKEFFFTGIPNVYLSPPSIRVDDKFFDPMNSWYFYSNQPLKNSLAKFAKFPIATDSSDNRPRLLLVAVDAMDGSAVTFDSYVKEGGIRKSEYGNYYSLGSDDNKPTTAKGYYKYVINYNEGVALDYAIASGSVPIGYDYTKLDVEERLSPTMAQHHSHQSSTDISSNKLHTSNTHNNIIKYKKAQRYFWDGGLLSNTPLRELLEAHRNYWLKVKKVGEDAVPSLNVYIVDVWPSREEHIPFDLDGAKDRLIDITLSDKTDYDQKVADIVSDYIQLFHKTREIAFNHIKDQNERDKFKAKLTELLTTENTKRSTHRTGEPRTYEELIKGRFDVKVIRIERKNSINDISNKLLDYSVDTLKQLRDEGYKDTLGAMQKHQE